MCVSASNRQKILNQKQRISLIVPKSLNSAVIQSVAESVFGLVPYLTDSQYNERWIQGLVLGLLEAKVGHMQVEHGVYGGRIDLRHGGSNPVLIELVTVIHGTEHYYLQNFDELQKLRRVSYSKAKRRILLILDFTEHPFSKQRLLDNYTKYGSGAGRFERNPVAIMYFHQSLPNPHIMRWK